MTNFESWGRFPRTKQTAQQPRFQDEIPHLLKQVSSTLAYGNGRSYGDSCLACSETVIGMRKLDRILSFDLKEGVIECESGLLLDSLIRHVLPHGWFPSVTPGTRFVTIGGAVANDVHGKNHHALGSFGDQVISFRLLTSDGRIRHCSRTENPDWFAATVGGLGLSGIITTVTMKLRSISSPWMKTESIRFKTIEKFFEISRESSTSWEYTVAWIDCLATGKSLGRGIFYRANHANIGSEKSLSSLRRVIVPFNPPVSLVEPWGVRPFNAIYYHRHTAKKIQKRQHYIPYFYPLDAIDRWNRLYGPRGFQQFQCVLPPDGAVQGCRRLLRLISDDGAGSFLAVLKQFGDRPASGALSFPRPGTTLALDFSNHGEKTTALLKTLSDVVAELGGAIYPAKDAQMSASLFRASYPAWTQVEEKRDPQICSKFWQRVALGEA